MLWHRLDRTLARCRPHRKLLTLLFDALVVAICWNFTYLFRLGFDRWWSARPGYDVWVMRRCGGHLLCWCSSWLACRAACGGSRASARSSG
ncbi:MAG: hypothetical protein V9G29_16600 [Burkholderiaceae bacterium]